MSVAKQIVKNQHYVWRKYLTAWSDASVEAGKRRIYVLRKQPRGTQPTIESALLVNVASEKFFYDISGHKPIDQAVMKQFLDYIQRRDSVKLEMDFQVLSEACSTRDYLENYVISPNENIDNEHCFLERLQNGDLSFYFHCTTSDKHS